VGKNLLSIGWDILAISYGVSVGNERIFAILHDASITMNMSVPRRSAFLRGLECYLFVSDKRYWVNERFGVSYLRTWDWNKFLTECIRVCRPGGVIRFTESTIGAETTSPALNHLHSLMLQAFHRAGHLWTLDRHSMINELPRLFTRHGLHAIQRKEYALHYQVGTPQGDLYSADMARGYRTVLPFLKKWTKVPDTCDEIYQQALREMQDPDFEATLTLLTVWGTVPRRNDDPQFLYVP
jgi:hypothetical protein